jgi:hypothetical protein
MGTTEECTANLVERYSTNLLRPIIAEFCGVVEPTVLRWFNGDNVPVGPELIKLRVFLQLAGYRVDELDMLGRQIRRLGEIIAVGLMTSEEVRDALDYKNVQDVYRLIRHGITRTVPSRQRKLERLVENLDEEREQKLAVWQGRIHGVIDDVEVSTKRRPATNGTKAVATTPHSDSGADVDAPAAIAELLQTMEHLTKALALLFTTLSDAQIEELQGLIGDNAMADLMIEFASADITR